MANLRKYVSVAYDSIENANQAFEAASARFNLKNPPVHNLSRVEGNLVYMFVYGVSKSVIEDFLLGLPGAQPKGCRFKVGV